MLLCCFMFMITAVYKVQIYLLFHQERGDILLVADKIDLPPFQPNVLTSENVGAVGARNQRADPLIR